MPVVDLIVPQMGEGLREVRIAALNKRPGERVRRDETVYTMETDKALIEVESPSDGTLVEWLVKEDDVLEIGAPVARLDVDRAEPSAEPPVAAAQQDSRRATDTGSVIPPRTRKYCKDLGIGDSEMRSIPAPSGKLMPADVDDYLATRRTEATAAVSVSSTGANFGIERDLSVQQKLFNYRARRSAQMVIPVTIGRPIKWATVAALATEKSAGDGDRHVTEFQVFAHLAARSASKFAKLRSVILSDEKVREYPHVNLGIAVARDNGDLLTAQVPAADSLAFDEFASTIRDRIRQARDGRDQAAPDMQLVLTYLGRYGITEGAPLLMAPAVAILFVGAVTVVEGVPVVNVALTFDHRLINGAEAAEFLADLAAMAETATA